MNIANTQRTKKLEALNMAETHRLTVIVTEDSNDRVN